MKKVVVFAALAVFAAMQFSCTKSDSGPRPTLKTDADKYSYFLGTMAGKQMNDMIGQNLTFFKTEGVAIDSTILRCALMDVLGKRTKLLSDSELTKVGNAFQALMMAKQQEKMGQVGLKNKADGEAFLAANAKKPGVITTKSGLQYQVIKQGSGPKPTIKDKVKVHYTGTMIDGKEFDSSIRRGQPVELDLKGVIAGWTEGLQLMNVGSKFKLFIPSNLAYGEQGRPGQGPNGEGGMPPNSTLIFDLELLGISK
jgi:FKBP-type peptidyl-prolyl cis-trans isomerase